MIYVEQVVFKKVLVANRGGSLRVIGACKELGIKTVAIHSEADAASLRGAQRTNILCRSAGSGVELSEYSQCSERCRGDRSGRHPSGLRIIVENAHFAGVCESIGVKFIGPTSENIALMGDKSKAREVVAKRGLR